MIEKKGIERDDLEFQRIADATRRKTRRELKKIKEPNFKYANLDDDFNDEDDKIISGDIYY